MIGTLLNVAGILVGGMVGLIRRRPLSTANESYLKVILAVFTVFYGLRLTWLSISGSLWEILKQVLILVLSLMLGGLAGRALRLQKMSNRLGQYARCAIAQVKPGIAAAPAEGFKTCAALFCAAPLGILGSIQDGLTRSSYVYPLAIKAIIDGFATLGFVSLFGWGVLLSAVPVLAFQGTITLICAHFLESFLALHHLLNSINAVGGLLVFCVALVMLGLKRIRLADYLPSLVVAPVITWVSQ